MPWRDPDFTIRAKQFTLHLSLPPVDSLFTFIFVVFCSLVSIIVYGNLIYRILVSPDHNILLAMCYVIILLIVLSPLFIQLKMRWGMLKSKRAEKHDQ